MKTVNVGAIALVDTKKKQLLLTRRPEGKHHAGRWEFFGGKLDEGEDYKDACVREGFEEARVKIKKENLEYLSEVNHPYKDAGFILNMELYSCEDWDGEPDAQEGHYMKWVEFKDIKNYELVPADIPLVEDFLKKYSPVDLTKVMGRDR